MNACTSPSDMVPVATRYPHSTEMPTYMRLEIKVVAGMMMPDMNCALNELLLRFSLSSPKSLIACWRRPKTFTSAAPVCISSTWPLSFPVQSHCAINCFWEAFAMRIDTNIESGIAMSETSASNGLIHTIIASTETTVNTEFRICDKPCCMDVEILSTSLVTLESKSPRDVPSK